MADQKNLKRKAVDHVHELFLSGKLRWGDLVSEEAIAKDIGISRTPVREALHIFTQMGVLQRVPRYGTIVRTPELREFEELFDVRRALECYAVEVAVSLITAEELESLRGHCLGMRELLRGLGESSRLRLNTDEVLQMFQIDYDFHLAILQATGNRMLVKHINDNRVLARLMGTSRVPQLDVANIADICEDHEAIVDAIGRHDRDSARKLLADHIDLSKRGVVAYMKKQLNQIEQKEDDHGRLGLTF
ncbi:GntR family transcriptional regulator [Coraliomargarita sp. SDUM461004]|uniref:GntR family transcriptional regulator n=1 Tax=Thalassobacterium sedimentorum TaxID=3041258 RepID=A0ABU1AEK0_9BACT|nr:GntR family transcriptional regulator [Coraliomargarita sp. SDUM461004]MDQ8192934.1 GntR family transcriptional regulator [Coraliomargarita sp. SDUM461004]